MKGNVIFKASIDATQLAKRLAKAETGELISYKELSEIIGRNIQNGARGTLMTARRIVQRDHGYVFACVIGKGIKRLDDGEIAESGKSTIAHIHRSSLKGAKRLACVKEYAAMDAEKKIAHNASLSVLGAIAIATQPKRLERVENKVKQAGDQLPLAKTLELFSD